MRWLIPAILLLNGCVGQTLYVMHNPKTGETVQCQADPHNEFVAAKIADDCARSYEKMGWVRVNP